MVASRVPPSGDLTCNPGMCPGWDLNQRPLDLQTGAESTDPHQPGLDLKCFKDLFLCSEFSLDYRL